MNLIEDSLSVTFGQYQSRFEVTAFSDNIAVSVRLEQGNDLLELLHFSCYLTWKLLAKGVLSRGGIALGELYHKGSIIYGPALLEAYQLESQVAIYPRIVVAHGAAEKARELSGRVDPSETPIIALLKEDSDGWKFVHVMAHSAMLPRSEMLSSDVAIQQSPISNELLLKAKVNVARKALESNPTSEGDVRSMSKHQWMSRYVDFYENIFNHAPKIGGFENALLALNMMPTSTAIPDETLVRAPADNQDQNP
ncbi:hypothetical protein QU481_12055 [Crenobacter sp. SG2303]|uniref:Uncharacterized protein n=1 Tax=Crenobacter oryzisoli TaxID=3056844 RepID=A0ABT7XPD3_9NEIS|nr:hypothetical protein [Crenobacter sp. SG2303]MDN0075626.1 hypothetical protein [Crenobacter sp. SG2303]